MSVTMVRSAFASASVQSVSMSQVLSVTDDGTNPTYLIVSGLDRNEYTVTSTGATGTLTGNGATATFSSIGGDGRGVGIVFTWDGATEQYVNATYGTLTDLTFNTSGSPNDLADISFFGTSSSTLISSADQSVRMALHPDNWTDFGTASFATQVVGSPTSTTQATPGSVCSTAMKFVGDVWNREGCWVLVSTVDAEAGAALTIGSNSVGTPGVNALDSEWRVAYDGPEDADPDWQSLLRAGDQVVLAHASRGGHITTVVSGQGSSAMLVDNIYYINGSNSADDGQASDLIISKPHLASGEFNGLDASKVVIYRLDTPTITDKVTADSTPTRQSQSLASLFSASDWAGTAITQYQVYEASDADSLSVDGVACLTAHSAGTAAACSSLAGLSFVAGMSAGSDTIEVRAQNASGYWGDWVSLDVAVQYAPTLTALTAMSSTSGPLAAGRSISFVVTPSEAVTVHTATGTPTLALSDGANAAYTGQSGNGDLLFSSIVAAGQNTTDLKVTGLALNGATITDQAGIALDTSGLAQLTGSDTHVVVETVLTTPAIVTELYEGLLGRAPDAAGLTHWTELLTAGENEQIVALSLLDSPEHTALSKDQFVSDLYQGLLGRTPGQPELQFWQQRSDQGASRAQLVVDIAASSEAQQRWAAQTKGDDQSSAFVTTLYEGVLSRAPTQAKVQAWVGTVNGDTNSAALAQAFLHSPEYQGIESTRFVTGLYQGFLGRAPDAAGLATWTQQLEGASPVQAAKVATAISNSAEAQQRWASVASQLTASVPDTSLITAAYEAALGRAPDQPSLLAWTQALQGGLTPLQFAQDIVTSPEFRNLHSGQSPSDVAASFYQDGLGRAGGLAEISGWTSQLQSGQLNNAGLLLDIAQSREAVAHWHSMY